MAMNCVLHDAARKHGEPRVIPPALVVLFGMSLCGACADGVAPLLADGASVRDILHRAVEGRVP